MEKIVIIILGQNKLNHFLKLLIRREAMNHTGNKKCKKAILGFSMIAIIFSLFMESAMSRVDEPKFTVLKSEDDIQIRQYEPMIVAEVEVIGERKQAINQGFRSIADYIFGNNTPKKKIAMTAPVIQQPVEKIAMTAPVTQQGMKNRWRVRFVMPSSYTMETLPTPKNSEVKLISIPPKRFAVIRFSGFNSDRNLTNYREKLASYITKNKLSAVGEPMMAYYNPPWTLPFLRRNEIMMELP